MENKKEFVLGELTYLEDAGTSKSSGNRLGKYRCFCGNEFFTKKSKVNTGRTKSCGCYQDYMMTSGEAGRKHDSCKTPLYFMWSNMVQRCTNPNNTSYYDYGERGITICNEWKDFSKFQDWAFTNGYKKGLSLDRANVNGNYEPSNCRWGNGFQQAQNRRKSSLSKQKYKGTYPTKFGKWGSSVTVENTRYSLGNYETEIAAGFAYDQMAKKYHKEYAHTNELNINIDSDNFIQESQKLFKLLSEKFCEQDSMALLKMMLIHGISDTGHTDKTGSR